MNCVNAHLIIKPAAQNSDGLILLRSDNPSSRRYQLILVLRHIGNRQLLNGADITLHVIEVDVAIRCDGEADFTELHPVPRSFLVIQNCSFVIFSMHFAIYKRASVVLTSATGLIKYASQSTPTGCG